MENVLPKSGWALYTASSRITRIFLGPHTFVFCFYADVMSTEKPAYTIFPSTKYLYMNIYKCRIILC